MVVPKVKTLLGLKLDLSTISSYKTHRRMCFIVFLRTLQFLAEDPVPRALPVSEELVTSANSLTHRVLGRFIYSECPRIPATWMPGKKLILNYQKPHIALSLSSKIQCVEFSWLCSSAPAFRSRGRSYMLRALYLQWC